MPSPPQSGQRRPNECRAVHRNMNDLIQARERRAKEQANKPLDRKKIREIKKKAQVLDDAYKLGDEFLQLKYTHVDHCLSQSAKAIKEVRLQYDSLMSTYVSHLEDWLGQMHQNGRYLEHEYCKIAFCGFGYLKQDLSSSARRIRKLQTAVLSQWVDVSQQLIKDLRAHLHQEYLKARTCARARIDRLLNHSEIIGNQYSDLQSKSTAVSNGLSAITVLLHSLVYLESRTESLYKPYLDATVSIGNGFSLSSHTHRWRWRMSKRHENPLGEAFLLEFSNLIKSDRASSATSSPSKVISALMFDDKDHRKTRAIMIRQELRGANRLRRPYLQRWKGPKPSWSPELDKYWRQLDVFAPFDLQRMYHAQTAKEVLYLVPTIQGGFGPMWEGLDDHYRKAHHAQLSDWYMLYRKQQKEFLRELEMYRYINWYRLEVEEKLATLGVLNLIQAEGLFVPSEPLSQDIGRFNRWIQKMVDVRYQGWKSEMAFRMLKEPNGLETWLELTERFHEEAAERKSQILDLGSVKVRRRGVSQKKAKISRFTKFKKVRRKDGWSVRSKPASDFWARPSVKETTSPHSEPRNERPSKSSKAPVSEKKPQASLSASKSSPQKASLSWKRKVARSRLGPTAVWDYLGQVKDIQPRPAPVNAKTRLLQAMSMKIEPDPGSHRNSDKPKTTKSTAVPPPISKPPFLTGWKTFLTKKGQPRESENAKRDSSTKGKPTPAGKPLKSTKRNFWDPNPIASSGGLFQRPKGRPYSTGSIVSRDHVLDGDHNNLSGATSSFDVRHTIDMDGEFPISTEDAYHLDIETTSSEEAPLFWSHSHQRAPGGQRPIVHYCKSLESTESVARYFLDSKVVGFDMEWKAQASATDSIQNNLSLIQLANEERIALFQIALFKPARSLEDFVAPSLKRIIESPDITKVGVSIKADSTRLRKHLGISARSIFELSHLYKLVKYGLTQPKLVNKRSVNLSEQVEEHLGLPLEKSEDVRCGDWARSLNYRQVQCEYSGKYPKRQ